MRVVQITPSFGTYGGIQAVVLELARFLRTTPDIEPVVGFKMIPGYTVSPDLAAALEQAEVTPVIVGPRSRPLWRLVKQADVVHLHTPSLEVAVATRLLRKPLAITIHNHRPPVTVSLLRRPALTAHQLSLRLGALLAHRRWYNSEFVWRTWEGNQRRATSERLPIVSRLPTGWVEPSARRGFVFVGRWVPGKGLRVLLRAYEQARLDSDRWPLTLIGDGPLRPEVESYVRERDIAGVRILGFLSEKDRDDALRGAMWLVAPAHIGEDLGLTPIEARHVGVPAIVARDGGLLEAAGAHGLSCEPNDVESLRDQLESASQMSDSDYEQIASATRQELLAELPPLTVYRDRYLALGERADGSASYPGGPVSPDEIGPGTSRR